MTDTIAAPAGAGGYEQLRYLTDQYNAVVKLRIANGNRLFAATEGLDENPPEPFMVEIIGDFRGIEDKLFRQMRRVVKDHPAWPWMGSVKGIGPTLATKTLGLIADIGRFPTISKLWAYSGYGLRPVEPTWDVAKTWAVGDELTPGNGFIYHIVDIDPANDSDADPLEASEFLDRWGNTVGSTVQFGQYTFENMGRSTWRIQRPVRGQKLDFNRVLKTTLYMVGDSFIKSKSPYTRIYYDAKQHYRWGKQINPMRQFIPEEFDNMMQTYEVPGDQPWLLREAQGEIPSNPPEGKKMWDGLVKSTNATAGAEKDHACWIDAHVDNAARRKMVKIFLSHLWLKWREAEGLPISDPYIIASGAPDHTVHTNYQRPEDFIE